LTSFNAYSGHLFVFVSRRCDRVKILTWDKGGFLLVYKRLERGQFKLPHIDPTTMAVEIDATQLAMLLDGIDFGRVRRPKHWSPSSSQADRQPSRRVDGAPTS
jgi:transposase